MFSALLPLIFLLLSWPVFSEPLILKFNFPPPEINKIGNYHILKVKNLRNYGNPGYPVLPFKTIKILVPYNCEVADIQIYPLRKRVVKGEYLIKPAQRQIPISKKGKVPYKFTPPAPEIYNLRKMWPPEFFKKGNVQILRGFKILPLNIYPYRYIPAERKIVYFPEIEVRVNFSEYSKKTLGKEERNLRCLSRDFDLIKKIVVNPQTAETYKSAIKKSKVLSLMDDPGPYDYIIITNQGLSSSFQNLINHKIQRGLKAKLVTVEDIYSTYSGIDNQEQIRNFIIDAYNNWGIDYVLLGGDTEIIPFRGVYGSCEGYVDYNIPCDMYYGCLDGTWDGNENGIYGEDDDNVDFFAEVYIGRAPVETVEEAQNFVNKTIEYENFFGDPYLKKVLLVGEQLWEDPLTWGGDYKDVIEPFFPPEYQIKKRYDKLGNFNGNGEVIIEEINQGVHLINHIGHADYWMVMWIGDWEFYDISEEPGDVMNEKKCFIYSQGCYAGAFDKGGSPGLTDECVGENFITSMYGAFAAVLNSRYGWFQPGDMEASVSQKFDEEFWDAIFNENIKNLGKANQDSKEDNYAALIEDITGGYKWCYFELNLLGDPELTIGGAVSRDGRIFFNKKAYKNGDEMKLTLMDMDLNVNHEEIDSFTVSITCSGGDVENLNLTETDKNTGIFEGTIILHQGDPNIGNGKIEAQHMETITAAYTDLDDGSGNQVVKNAICNADFVPPQITNIEISDISNDSAKISWNTDEPANGKVTYGLSIPPELVVSHSDFLTNHSIQLSGLQEGNTYYFKITSEDEAGNISENDNNGNYFSFNTKIACIIFQDDIESGQGEWEVSYEAPQTPQYNWYITNNFSHSGTSCWHYCREEWSEEDQMWNFFYYPGIEKVHGFLTSPEIDLSSVSNARLTFYHLLSIGGPSNTWDWARVEISVDGGNWETLIEPEDTSGFWEKVQIFLTPYIGHRIRIRFHFYVDWYVAGEVYPGWFIDDVKIEYFVEEEVISISVTPTDWAIGNVSLGEEKSTAENYFTATNGGNVAEDFTIVCGNSANWTCGDTAGSEIFEMKAKGGDLSDWTSIHSSQTLKSNVAVGGTVSFGLKFKAPTLTSYTDTQQTITVTITASKH